MGAAGEEEKKAEADDEESSYYDDEEESEEENEEINGEASTTATERGESKTEEIIDISGNYRAEKRDELEAH